MIKYLVVYELEYIKPTGKPLQNHWYKENHNEFFFFERYPYYSVIMEKLLKKHNSADYKHFRLTILGIYTLENEPTDIEGKEVIKL